MDMIIGSRMRTQQQLVENKLKYELWDKKDIISIKPVYICKIQLQKSIGNAK